MSGSDDASRDAPDGPLDGPGDRLPTPSTSVSPFSRRGTPAPLSTAAGLVAVQGVVTVLVAATDVVHLHSGRMMMGLTAAVFFAAYGVGLVACAVGLQRMRPWARGPALLAQLIWLGVAWSFRGSPTTLVAVVLALTAAIALLGLLTPASVEALNRPEHRHGQRPADGPDQPSGPERG